MNLSWLPSVVRSATAHSGATLTRPDVPLWIVENIFCPSGDLFRYKNIYAINQVLASGISCGSGCFTYDLARVLQVLVVMGERIVVASTAPVVVPVYRVRLHLALFSSTDRGGCNEHRVV